jgi:hypothetical protein
MTPTKNRIILKLQTSKKKKPMKCINKFKVIVSRKFNEIKENSDKKFNETFPI